MYTLDEILYLCPIIHIYNANSSMQLKYNRAFMNLSETSLYL